jgi:hypothetical protein
VSEQRLPKYRPGDEIEMLVHIQHAPMHLREGTARFFSKGQEGGIISHIDLSGTPSISEEQPSQLQAPLQRSEVRLSAKVAPDDAPGVYRLNRVSNGEDLRRARTSLLGRGAGRDGLRNSRGARQ